MLESEHLIGKVKVEPGEMVHPLRALAPPAEDRGLVPSTRMVADNNL